MEYYARKGERSTKQLLTDHIDGVIKNCQGSNMDSYKSILELAAIAHDMGKFSLEWQRYMLEDLSIQVPHSTSGMALIFDLIKETTFIAYPDNIKVLLQDIISYAIGAHHGLFDALTINGKHIIDEKIVNAVKKKDSYEEAKKAFLSRYKYDQLKKLTEDALKECSRFMQKLHTIPGTDENHLFFYLGFLVRMILSTLMDGDWSDAANFFDKKEEFWKIQKSKFSWEPLAKRLDEKLMEFPIDSRLNRLRSQISKECFTSAERKGGIYKLDVPTGGAKTLSVMR